MHKVNNMKKIKWYTLLFNNLPIILMKAYNTGQCIHVLCVCSIVVLCLAKKVGGGSGIAVVARRV